MRYFAILFWNIYIADALLGNSDRHGVNWGFIKTDKRYTPAPVFDNGSCLYPNMTDESMMAEIIASREMTDERIYGYPASQIDLDGRKSSYAEVIGSFRYGGCNRALLRMFPRINLTQIRRIIQGTEYITEQHKAFCIHMIEQRYRKILAEPYGRLTE